MGHWGKCSNKAIIKPDSEEGANWGDGIKKSLCSFSCKLYGCFKFANMHKFNR